MLAAYVCRTPVVLMVFNRPHLTRQVIDSIRSVRPERLFIISDGPRAGIPADVAKVNQVRRLIDEQVDWPCRVHKDYAKVNLGCARRVASGLNAVFAKVEQAIIIEDDCVAVSSFFRFCEEMLASYADDGRVMHISGDNFVRSMGQQFSSSYYFSIHAHCWGWATWRRAWQHYDHSMKSWPDFRDDGKLSAMGLSASSRRYFADRFTRVAAETMDSWAFRWTFACWANNGLAILPTVNLVRNIGFVAEATHTLRSYFWVPSRCEELSFPLLPPEKTAPDREADATTNDLLFSEGTISHFKRRWLQWKSLNRRPR